MALAHNEAWDGDSVLRAAELKSGCWVPKKWKKICNRASISQRQGERSLECAVYGFYKAKTRRNIYCEIRHFWHKNIEIQHNNAIFLNCFVTQVASSERSHRRDSGRRLMWSRSGGRWISGTLPIRL